MAIFKYYEFLSRSREADTFETEHAPSTVVPLSGIYRCAECGREIVSNESDSFPPENHHLHTEGQGPISWLLIVLVDQRPKPGGELVT